jgi:hypothetical protein
MSFVVFCSKRRKQDGVFPLFGMLDQLIVVGEGYLTTIAAQLNLHGLVWGR